MQVPHERETQTVVRALVTIGRIVQNKQDLHRQLNHRRFRLALCHAFSQDWAFGPTVSRGQPNSISRKLRI